jgi:hypothetical protein
MSGAGGECGRPVREPRIEDLLMALLEAAQDGLSREPKCIDELIWLRQVCLWVPPHRVPPEAVRFLAGFRRERGRMHSEEAARRHFWADPDLVAAMLAARCVGQLRRQNGGRYKITLGDGSKDTVHAAAVRWAASFVNRSKVWRRPVNEMRVRDLLNKGKARTTIPSNPAARWAADFLKSLGEAPGRAASMTRLTATRKKPG